MIAVICVGTFVGCQNLVNRGQSRDGGLLKATETEDTSETKYVARICKMAGLAPQKVEGVALVSNLDGTGSAAKPGELRKRLLRDLETIKTPMPAEELLQSKSTEMVLVKGLLPAGVKKGDPFDLEIIPLNETDATSLEGGYIQKMRLRITAQLGGTVKEGHLQGLGKGRVITNSAFETRDDASNRLSGLVIGGGISKVDRDLALLIRTGSKSIRTSTFISAAINERFTVSTSSGLEGVANSKTDQVIELKIPSQYRHNVGRFAQVISNMAYDEPAHLKVNRMDTLGVSLQDPLTAGLSAIRLEAIGKQTLPTLKRALSSGDLQVRFAAAQSLAYQGINDGVEVLTEAARSEPAFRWQALTALTTLESAVAENALESLLSESSAETRYGAFRAIRKRNPQSPLVAGQWLTRDFKLCLVDNQSSPLLHFSKYELAEIVVFNDSQTFGNKFLYVESGLTVKSNNDGTVTVATYHSNDSFRATCSDRVSDVLQTVSQAGYGYETLLKMSRLAMKEGTLNGRLVVDATPKVGRRYQSKPLPGTMTRSTPLQSSPKPMAAKLADRIASYDRLRDPNLRQRFKSGVQRSAGVIKDAAVKPSAWWSKTGN
jgi:flagellar basal body P-ring protein FlgI